MFYSVTFPKNVGFINENEFLSVFVTTPVIANTFSDFSDDVTNTVIARICTTNNIFNAANYISPGKNNAVETSYQNFCKAFPTICKVEK
jgi:hypothetical protein